MARPWDSNLRAWRGLGSALGCLRRTVESIKDPRSDFGSVGEPSWRAFGSCLGAWSNHFWCSGASFAIAVFKALFSLGFWVDDGGLGSPKPLILISRGVKNDEIHIPEKVS